jgi:hypothetical protein
VPYTATVHSSSRHSNRPISWRHWVRGCLLRTPNITCRDSEHSAFFPQVGWLHFPQGSLQTISYTVKELPSPSNNQWAVITFVSPCLKRKHIASRRKVSKAYNIATTAQSFCGDLPDKDTNVQVQAHVFHTHSLGYKFHNMHAFSNISSGPPFCALQSAGTPAITCAADSHSIAINLTVTM